MSPTNTILGGRVGKENVAKRSQTSALGVNDLAFNIVEYMAAASVHSLAIALVVEAMLRIWHLQPPRQRLAFRLLVLVLPLAALPLFRVLWPVQQSLPFKQQFALLDVSSWLEIGLWRGLALWHLVAGALGITTVLFLVQEVMPTLQHHLFNRNCHIPIVKGQLPKLDRALDRLARSSSHPLPPVHFCQQEQPTAYACGLLHHSLVVSPSLVEVLDEEELEACLAHELAHLKHRDNWTGWLFLALRAAQFYNPVAMLVARHMLQDNERACDERAASLAGKPLALASSLVKVFRETEAQVTPSGPPGWRGWVSSRVTALEDHARLAATESRVTRIMQPLPSVAVPYLGLRFGLCLVAMLALQALIL
ncbi:MAG: M56 family metallopeptidase [Chloroflexota bacterium]